MEKIFEQRIFRTIKNYGLVENGDKICVALSGGKDSACALFLLKKYAEKNKINCEIKALHLNLGIKGFEKMVELCEAQANLAGVKLYVFDAKSYGIDVEELSVKKKRPVCSVCGVVKRYLLNKLARELACNKLATGHNMDDFLVFFFKNLLSKNYCWIAKFRPKTGSPHEKIICRIRPLFFVGNRETEILCERNGIPYSESACVYSKSSAIIRKRENWYRMLYSFERLQKDFRYLLAQSVAEMSRFFEKTCKEEFKECKLCGEPTSQEVCGFCKLTKT